MTRWLLPLFVALLAGLEVEDGPEDGGYRLPGVGAHIDTDG